MLFPNVFTEKQQQVLAVLHERDSRERREGIRDSKALKALAPSVAQLLFLLVLQKRARTIAEFGTSHGFSTIHLAAAAEKTDGQVHSVDADPQKTEWARRNLQETGLAHRVALTTAEGADFAASLPEAVDFVLVDYGVVNFGPTFANLRPKLAKGCLLFVDGGPEGYWESRGAAFRELLENDPDFIGSVLPMDKDQLMAVRVR